ncbi:MAG: hypothetical protein HY608_02520 [Planctomycetes bacterium]|nr:hypothetical protein [Planctomycetota bacterium]
MSSRSSRAGLLGAIRKEDRAALLLMGAGLAAAAVDGLFLREGAPSVACLAAGLALWGAGWMRRRGARSGGAASGLALAGARARFEEIVRSIESVPGDPSWSRPLREAANAAFEEAGGSDAPAGRAEEMLRHLESSEAGLDRQSREWQEGLEGGRQAALDRLAVLRNRCETEAADWTGEAGRTVEALPSEGVQERAGALAAAEGRSASWGESLARLRSSAGEQVAAMRALEAQACACGVEFAAAREQALRHHLESATLRARAGAQAEAARFLREVSRKFYDLAMPRLGGPLEHRDIVSLMETVLGRAMTLWRIERGQAGPARLDPSGVARVEGICLMSDTRGFTQTVRLDLTLGREGGEWKIHEIERKG